MAMRSGHPSPCLLALSGPVSAGKTTTGALLSAEFGWPVVSISAVIAEVAIAQGMPRTREVLQMVGAKLINKNALEFAQLVLDSSGWLPGAPVIVDGVRQMEVQSALAISVAPTPARLLFLEAPFEIRARRAALRDGVSAERLRSIEQFPIERRLAGLRPAANFIVATLQPPSCVVQTIADWLYSLD